MKDFLWLDWNRAKIDFHAYSTEEVEFAWHRRIDLFWTEHPNGPFCTSIGECPSGKPVKIMWRYNTDWDGEEKVFVITAHSP